jgi:hypothetical protein
LGTIVFAMPDIDLSSQLESESWDSLALKLKSIPIKLNDPNLKKVEKEMQLLKHVLYEQLLTFNGNNEIDTSFFVGAIKTHDRIEKELDKHGIKNNEFMIFLGLLLGKVRKQKLLVKKPLEMQKEFGKMKGVVEDADSL